MGIYAIMNFTKNYTEIALSIVFEVYAKECVYMHLSWCSRKQQEYSSTCVSGCLGI